MVLHNRVNREELKKKMLADDRPYTTLSFYRYHHIEDTKLFRDQLYQQLAELEAVGRLYIAHEGINAQMALPSDNFEALVQKLNEIPFLRDMRLNTAIEEKQKSFYKLDVRLRAKIVADGIHDPDFNPANTGHYLDAAAWNAKMEAPGTVVIDMRNHYESEVGRFKNAETPDADTFREELDIVVKEYAGQQDKQILMYCTGGIRCEKASAWMKHKGFSEVYHLEGGIINYVKQVKEKALDNKFQGVNFVFDQRLAERVSADVIAHCHQCGEPADTHVNCANTGCHLLFIQCGACAKKYSGCCSEECVEVMGMPAEKQREWRRVKRAAGNFSKGRGPLVQKFGKNSDPGTQ